MEDYEIQKLVRLQFSIFHSLSFTTIKALLLKGNFLIELAFHIAFRLLSAALNHNFNLQTLRILIFMLGGHQSRFL